MNHITSVDDSDKYFLRTSTLVIAERDKSEDDGVTDLYSGYASFLQNNFMQNVNS